MIHVTPTSPAQTPTARTGNIQPCTHNRIVDEVRTLSGAKTGQLICIECLAVFPDPLYQEPHS